MSLVSWVKGLFNRNRYEYEDEDFASRSNEPTDIKHYVINLCEQMIDVSRELEEVRAEYDKVTSYLNDIQIIEGLEGTQKEEVLEIAVNVNNLTKVRKEYMNIQQNISDAVFMQMKEAEDVIPDAIRRLKSNEAYLDTIKRDMNYLEAEKVEWSVLRQERKAERKNLKRMAQIMMFLFGGVILALLIVSVIMEWTSVLPIMAVLFLATLCGAYIVLRIQECNRDIKKCDVNQNRAIYLENKVKIKYVNMKNAVDYACQKYHVNNSQELTYNYEQFIEITKEREKLKETNEDLIYYTNKLVRSMLKLNLYDAKIWQDYSYALVNPKEMVELKHDLFVRRQKLRERMEYNMNAIAEMREDARRYCDVMEDKTPQVREILQKIEEISRLYV